MHAKDIKVLQAPKIPDMCTWPRLTVCIIVCISDHPAGMYHHDNATLHGSKSQY